MEDNENWATATLREAPFWRDGMMPEEYDKEREYYYDNFRTPQQLVNYIPLWKQRQNSKAQ